MKTILMLMLTLVTIQSASAQAPQAKVANELPQAFDCAQWTWEPFLDKARVIQFIRFKKGPAIADGFTVYEATVFDVIWGKKDRQYYRPRTSTLVQLKLDTDANLVRSNPDSKEKIELRLKLNRRCNVSLPDDQFQMKGQLGRMNDESSTDMPDPKPEVSSSVK